MNKKIERDTNATTRVLDRRTLHEDYKTIIPIIGRQYDVLDVGCGTGSITSGIAQIATGGTVIGIDNNEAFIETARKHFDDISNLHFVHADLFAFSTDKRFDLVVAARVLQWFNEPGKAVQKLSSLLKPDGVLSVLDYNHEELEWYPAPPPTMQKFFKAFLQWRKDSGFDNRIAENLERHFREGGLKHIETHNADENYVRGSADFRARMSIWSSVAELKQIVEEGYIDEAGRLAAIADYNRWIDESAERMVMKLSEVRGRRA